ncbi:hypothetical protein B484DRAFT_406328 [Ochromonadaceae sp. CCMP2298]|nr:hypothetical protein B484DRAFT_406328 [Ochromonadaceae sp. CCMP2298]
MAATVTLNSGMTVTSGGARVTGGLTVYNSGLHLTDGLTVYNAGIRIKTGGLVVTDGLTVNGVTNVESSPVVFSDRRLKTNLAPIADALHKVSRLQGVYFNWVSDAAAQVGGTFDDKRHVGVIAQEVLAVLPEVVMAKNAGDFLGVDYASIVPLLIEAIHDLEQRVVDLDDAVAVGVGKGVLGAGGIGNVGGAGAGAEVWAHLQALRDELASVSKRSLLLEGEMKGLVQEQVQVPAQGQVGRVSWAGSEGC